MLSFLYDISILNFIEEFKRTRNETQLISIKHTLFTLKEDHYNPQVSLACLKIGVGSHTKDNRGFLFSVLHDCLIFRKSRRMFLNHFIPLE